MSDKPSVDVDQGRAVYSYELMPINFIMLPQAKQEELINRFHGFLNSFNSRVRILVSKGSRSIQVGSTPFDMEYYRFFLESFDDPIEHLLDSFGLLYQRVVDLPRMYVVRVFPKHMVLPEGRPIRYFTIYRLPSQLVEGF